MSQCIKRFMRDQYDMVADDIVSTFVYINPQKMRTN